MNVVVLIKGREAVPVRALPLLSNWRFMSVGDVVHLLGGTNARNVNLLGDLQSNHIVDGNVEPIVKDWWVQSPLWELRALSERKEIDKSAWRKQSLKELPAGAFVWKDDYQKLHERRWNCDYQQMYFGLEYLNSQRDAQESEADVSTYTEGETLPKWSPEKWVEHISTKEYYWESIEVLERWREPNYSPFMLPELCAVVMEGFEQLSPAEDQAAKSLISEINKLEIEITYWETRDDSTASDALIVERQLARLRPKLAELLEKKRGLRGDYLDNPEIPLSTASSPVMSQTTASKLIKTEPLPLTTGDIAFCFAELRWTEAQWKKPLGDKPKWLQSCIAIPGLRGVYETRWNPVSIGAALVSNGHAKTNNVRARFQTKSFLMPWLDAWKTYEADNFDT
jgi:hypothetical protein